MQNKMSFSFVRKRDNRLVKFNNDKIEDAIFAAFEASGQPNRQSAQELAEVVCYYLSETVSTQYPSIEEIQDIVEKVLIETNHHEVAKSYILYREERARMRAQLYIYDSVTLLEKVWDKSKLLHYLIVDIGLDETSASSVVNGLEKILFNMGMNKISNTLLLELISNYLCNNGFGSQSKIIRLNYNDVADNLYTPDAFRKIYKILSEAVLLGGCSDRLSKLIEAKILLIDDFVLDIICNCKPFCLTMNIEMDLMPMAKEIGKGEYGNFVISIINQIDYIVEYFKIQTNNLAIYLQQLDAIKYADVIKKCHHKVSPLDKSKPIIMYVDLLNIDTSLKYMLGLEKTDELVNEIFNKLNSAITGLPNYQQIIFTRKDRELLCV